MNEFKLSDLEDYNAEKFSIKKLHESTHSKTMLLHLLPGQEVPVHPHNGMEVTLFPQKGHATLISNDDSEAPVTSGSFYSMGVGPVFGIRNMGQEPFQMVIVLMSLGEEKKSRE